MSASRIDFQANLTDASGTTHVAPAVNVAANDLLQCTVRWEGAATTCTVTDSSSNTWVGAVTSHSSASTHVWEGYCTNPAANAALVITATLGAARSFKRTAVEQWRSTLGAMSPSGAAFSGESSSTSLSLGSKVLPANSLLLVSAAKNQDRVITWGGFATPEAGVTDLLNIGYRIDAAGSTQTVSATLAVATDWVMVGQIFTESAATAPNDPTDITVSAQTETSAGLTGAAAGTATTPTAWELQSSAIGGPGAGDWAGTGSQAGNTWTVTPGTTVGTYRRIRAGAGGLWSGWYYEQVGYLNPVEGGGGELDGGSGGGGGSVLVGLAISPPVVARAQTGSTVQFTLSGLVSGSPVSPLPASWSVMSGSGSIDSNGLLTVGSLSGPIVVRATPSADTLQSITATVLQVTKDMDDTSIQTQSYKNGIYTAEFLFNSGPGRVKVTALYGGVSQERIFGPGMVVPVAWNLGIQSQEVRFSVIGLPAA